MKHIFQAFYAIVGYDNRDYVTATILETKISKFGDTIAKIVYEHDGEWFNIWVSIEALEA